MVTITGRTALICSTQIEIGQDTTISWDNLFMTTDFHPIYMDGRLVNEDKAIKIGNHCWIGARCTILKGTDIPSGSVIAAGTKVTKRLRNPNCVYGGEPVHILKDNIVWER